MLVWGNFFLGMGIDKIFTISIPFSIQSFIDSHLEKKDNKQV